MVRCAFAHPMVVLNGTDAAEGQPDTAPTFITAKLFPQPLRKFGVDLLVQRYSRGECLVKLHLACPWN